MTVENIATAEKIATVENLVVILFHTSNHAFRAEKVLKDHDICCKLVPVPRHLSSDCGVCARIEASKKDDAVQILTAAHVETTGVHVI